MTPGTRLGPYEIVAPLGSGGMGEVYQARDTRLDRFVAIKVLPADKIADAERTRRFIQEARSASALNHPNIVTIYDVGSENGIEFLAMELVDGRTLEDLVPRDGFRIPELLRYAVQAADALAKAHAAGIIHRDFKPGNVMVTRDGLVKVLDFGLAKLVQPQASDSAKTMATASDPGLIVGTAAFMSPEQAEGKPVDARSDIFAFGAVLYEMATGQRAFRGDTAMSTISAILRDDPRAATSVRREIPAELERIIKRCLRKDPARRFQTMADLKVAFEELKEESDSGTLAGPAHAAPARARGGPPGSAIAIGFAVVALTGAAAWWFGLRKAPALDRVSMQRPVPLTSYPGQESDPTFSPDGSQVAFSWTGEKDDNRDIYVKVVGPDAPLRLTTDPAPEGSPRWSPDGRTIAFARYGTDDSVQVMLIPPLGGTERTLARFAHGRRLPMLDWSPDGKWLAVAANTGEGPVRVYIVAADSGDARPLTMPSASAFDIAPAFSPDGRALAFTRATGMNVADLWVQRMSASMEAEGEPRKLPAEGSFARGPVWTLDGREILYTSGLNLRANVYRMAADGSAPSRVVELGDGAGGPSLSRTGRRLAFERTGRNSNIWRLDLRSPGQAGVPLISSTVREASPQYSPDGKRIVFYSNRSGSNQIWVSDADGARATQLTSMNATITGSPRWFPDGRHIVFDSNAGSDWQVYVLDADGGRPKAVTSGKGGHFVASVSRDGRWVYFTAGNNDEQVWKVPAAGGAEVHLTAGGAPMESPDGKSLYFTRALGRANQNSLWRMPAGGGEAAQVVPLLYRYNYAVTATGIYYDTPSDIDAPPRIAYLDLATGKTAAIYTLTKPVDLGMALSPDGRYLLFAQNDFTGSDLMLVENFR